VHSFFLEIGEHQAILLALEYSNAVLLTDGAAARLVAERSGLRVHGTLGILLRSVRRNQRTPKVTVTLLPALRLEVLRKVTATCHPPNG